jgi:hypothetical protein
MRNAAHSPSALQRGIYTLAQSGTGKAVKSKGKPQIIVSGNGSELSNAKALEGRARRKMISQKTALSLVDAAKAKGAPERTQAYWNIFHCQNKIFSAGGKLYGKYCKNRSCTVCCANRKAELINKYLPTIQTWEDPYFVTLTAKAVSARGLNERMNKMVEAFCIIKTNCKKRYQRGKGIKFEGVKTLECNFNAVAKTYNPHFHFIVPNKEMADLLVKEWLCLWTDNGSPKHRKWASSKAQHSRKVDDREKCLIEVVKYGSKIFTELDLQKKTGYKIYTRALDNILAAFKGHRLFERFGFNLPESKAIDKPEAQILDQYEEWEYITKQADWVNLGNEKRLTDYLPPPQLAFLLENNINAIAE